MKTMTITLLAGAALALATLPATADSMPSQERYQIADAGGVEPAQPRRAVTVKHRRVERRATVTRHRAPVVNARAAIPQDCWAPVKVATRVLAPPSLGRQYGGDTDTNAVSFIFGLGPDSPAPGRYQNIPSVRGESCRN